MRGAFNRRHRRAGPICQNRETSIVVEDDPSLLELVRYLHLNPVRAKGVADLRALDRYPWTGHSALLGTAQTRAAVRARQLVAYVWVEHLGRRASDLARSLGQSRGNVSLAAKRGTAHAAAWRAQIADWYR